jgi:hypothetical protein
MYEITAETGMPNLEANLRYTVTREERCLTEGELLASFPVLSHPSLAGCRLGDEHRENDVVTLSLSCGNGTSGAARWRVGSSVLQGTLSVKLGGKNMTFFQRLTARRLGPGRTSGPGCRRQKSRLLPPEAKALSAKAPQAILPIQLEQCRAG